MPVEKDISPLERALMTAQVQNIFGDKQSYEYEGAVAESTYQPYGTMYDYTEPMQGGDGMGMIESLLSPGPGYNVLERMKGKWEAGEPMQAAGEIPLLIFALSSLLGGRRMVKKLMKRGAAGKLTKADVAKIERTMEHLKRSAEPYTSKAGKKIIPKPEKAFISEAEFLQQMSNPRADVQVSKLLYKPRNWMYNPRADVQVSKSLYDPRRKQLPENIPIRLPESMPKSKKIY
jgi:hypothetical protein